MPWLAAAVAVATLAAVVSTRWLGPDPQVVDLELSGRLTVMPFTNDTGEPANDWVTTGLAEMVTETIARTPGVEVASSERLHALIAARDLDTGDSIGRERIRSLALAAGASLVLEARFRHHGSRRDGVRRNGVDDHAADFLLFDADGVVAESTVEGSDFLEVADRLAFSVARGLSSGRVPVRLTSVYSRDRFSDRLYAMGRHRLSSDGVDTAVPYFEIALRSRPSFLQAKAALAECAERDGDLERAGELVREVLEEARGRGEQHLQLWSLEALGRLAVLQGRLEVAQENYSQAYSAVLAADDAAARGELLSELSRLALVRGDSPRAEELLIEALQIRQNLGDRLGEVDTLLEIATLFKNGGDLGGARDILRQAQQIAVSLNDVWTEMRVLTSLGDVACDQAEVADCVELLQRAVVFYDQRGDKSRKLSAAHRLAEMRVVAGDLDRAEDLFRDVIELAAELERPEIEAAANLRVAWILLRGGYPRQARGHLDRALALDRYLDKDRYHLQVVIGWFAYEQGNYRLAVDTLLQARRQAEEAWPGWATDYLRVFEEAELVGRRLPLPGEDGYRRPE